MAFFGAEGTREKAASMGVKRRVSEEAAMLASDELAGPVFASADAKETCRDARKDAERRVERSRAPVPVQVALQRYVA